jgi:hypothetical protein
MIFGRRRAAAPVAVPLREARRAHLARRLAERTFLLRVGHLALEYLEERCREDAKELAALGDAPPAEPTAPSN